MSKKPTLIAGRVAVLVNRHTTFDLGNPGATPVHAFTYINAKYAPDGQLDTHWVKSGYRLVGYAEIAAEIMPTGAMLAGAVACLREERKKILADAQKEATRIEGEIQKLLAIEFDGAAA
jgi:hypothetical protein